MARGEGPAVWSARRGPRYDDWSIPSSRRFLPEPLQLAVRCRIKGARGHWIAARAGLNGARTRRDLGRDALREVTSVRRPSRPARYGARYGGRYGRPNARQRKSGYDHPVTTGGASPNRARAHPGGKRGAAIARPVDDIGAISRERARTTSVLMQDAVGFGRSC